MLLWAGLGNPGPEHAQQRHNIGFMAADAIARRHGFSPWTRKFKALVAEGTIGGDKVLLIKPQTFMNLSGEAVGEALRFFKLPLAALTVFYDELDLAPGKVRIKVGGGAGGHNGIRSIDAHCGKDYRRVRIGIGHPGVKELVHGHVLGNFAKADAAWLQPLLEAIADHAGLLAAGDDNGFMNKASLAVRGEAKPALETKRNALARPPAEGAEERAPTPGGKGQSHIRPARPQPPAAPPPQTGPMAAMLKKLLGKEP